MAEEKKESVVVTKNLTPMPLPKRGYAMQTGSIANDDGHYLIYSTSSNVIVRNLDNPEGSKLFGNHKARVTCATPSPNGEFVASADEKGEMMIWSMQDLTVKHTASGTVAADIAWSADGSNVGVIGVTAKGTAGYIYNTRQGKKLHPLTGYGKDGLSCDFGNDCFVTGDELGNIRCHTGHNYAQVKTLKSHNQFVNTLRFSPDKTKMISVSSDKKIVIYNDKVEQIKKIDKAHKGSIYSCSWSTCGKYVLTSSAAKNCKIWDVESGESTKTFTWENNLNNMQMACNWIGDHLVSFGLDGNVYFLNKESGDHRSESGILYTPTAFGFDRTNNSFFIGERKGRIVHWSEEGGWKLISGTIPTSGIKNVGVSCDGETAWALDSNKTVHEIECKEMKISKTIALSGHGIWLTASKKDPSMFAVGVGEKIIIYKEGEILAENSTPFEPFRFNFSADDQFMAIMSERKKKILRYDFDVTSGKLDKQKVIQSSFTGKPTQVRFGYKGDDTFISCSTANSRIGIFLEDKQKNYDNWEGHCGQVYDHAWNPSGTMVASVGQDKNVIVWLDTDKFRSRNKHVLKLVHPKNGLFIRWIDDNHFLTVGTSGMVIFWETNF